ncbi:origin recognition complex subunit 3 isoform X2 [Monomorium pharaonis]|uniref:origin recognition complex subunit 3 isoform X2 n=1 Tax=Monomorium pharaonis TaxID=307658 RepID=UPI00102E163B|nr:origin recognition complex subunit 3 isoform X2 [Monomorium pharaonis]
MRSWPLCHRASNRCQHMAPASGTFYCQLTAAVFSCVRPSSATQSVISCVFAPRGFRDNSRFSYLRVGDARLRRVYLDNVHAGRRMENVSLSKGVFAYKGSYKIGKKKKTVYCPAYLNEPWYIAYNETWGYIEQAAENVRSKMFQQVISNLESFVSKIKATPLNVSSHEIATAILLTGVNVPDHTTLFDTTVSKLSKITPHLAVIWSRNCNSVKSIIEDTVYQFIHQSTNKSESDDVPDIRKSQCTMRVLTKLFAEHHDPEDPLVVILPDFESFSTNVLHDFILVLSSYRSTLKFVLIFGVATTLHVVHKSLTYDVTSKLVVQVFYTQTQVKTLADILESTVFSTKIPFKLIGRAFQLLTDIFLFYDFSVDNFLQNYKICMIQHFYENNVSSLCCQPKDIKERISRLTDKNIADIKSLPSIAKYLKAFSEVENGDKELSDEEFMELLEQLLNKFHKFMDQFLIVLRCLHCLVTSLPGSPMGKQLREVYTKAVYTNDLIESFEYKECLKLLGFLSKEELLSKLESIVKIVEESKDSKITKIKVNLNNHIETIREASLSTTTTSEIISVEEKLSRMQLKEKLLKMSQQQSRSAYKQAQLDLIDYLDRKVFSVHLIDPSRVTAHEIFCYSDGNQAKHHIRGSLRAAIHTGLSDPQMYLDCDCCKLENDDDIPRTLPDLSIIYKLHLESRKLINMYDWLQAFLTIADPRSQSTEQRDVDPQLQARFTQAVAALQFLGFIKTSRRKTDHVKRLT